MTFPDDLPSILYYLVGTERLPIVLTTLPRTPVVSISTSGVTNANTIRPRIPYGCRAWRRRDDDPWLPLEDLPAAWLPFLQRDRGTQMDPRPKVQ